MPESYEQAVEERAGEDLGDPEPEEEHEPDIRTQDLADTFGEVQNLVEAVPDFLKPDSEQGSGDIPDIGGNRGQLDLDLSFDDLSELSDSSLLQVIARVNIAQLAALFDIADAVEPFSTITVSGVNAIDDANTAQPVVPRSDTEAIPTRTLFMRADENNNDSIYIGDDEVEPQSGLILGPGEFYVAESDLRAEEFWMASETEGQEIQLLGLV